MTASPRRCVAAAALAAGAAVPGAGGRRVRQLLRRALHHPEHLRRRAGRDRARAGPARAAPTGRAAAFDLSPESERTLLLDEYDRIYYSVHGAGGRVIGRPTDLPYLPSAASLLAFSRRRVRGRAGPHRAAHRRGRTARPVVHRGRRDAREARPARAQAAARPRAAAGGAHRARGAAAVASAWRASLAPLESLRRRLSCARTSTSARSRRPACPARCIRWSSR